VAGGPGAFLVERHRLAADLKRIREAAGLTTRQLAARLGVSSAKVVHMETGRRGAKPEDVAAWARLAGLADRDVQDLVQRAERAQTEALHVRRVHQPGGLGLPAVQRDVAGLEEQARVIRVFQPLLIPGLLQTAEYARRIFMEGEPDRPDIPEAVAARMERQAVLYDPGKRFELLVAEAALWWQVAPWPAQARQLDRIRQAATLSTVWLGIVPLGVEAPIFHDHGFSIFDEPAEDGDPLVMVETLTFTLTLTEPAVVEEYREAFRRLQAVAVTGPQALEILTRVEAALAR